MIVIDTTNAQTFAAVDMWLREVSKNGGEKLPSVLVGSKSDLKAKRKVKKEEALAWAQKREGFLGYFEVSAKDCNGYFDMMSEVVSHILNA